MLELTRREVGWFLRQVAKRAHRAGGFRGIATIRFEDAHGRRLWTRSENVITNLGLWEAYSLLFGDVLSRGANEVLPNTPGNLTWSSSYFQINQVQAYNDGITQYSGYFPFVDILGTSDTSAESQTQCVLPSGVNCAVRGADSGYGANYSTNQVTRGDMQIIYSLAGVVSPPTIDSLAWTSYYLPNGTAKTPTSLYAGGVAGGTADASGLEIGAKTLLAAPVTPAANTTFHLEYDFLFS